MAQLRQQKTTTENTLQDAGLSENEAILYALMLHHPQSTVRDLSTRAPLPRTMLYYVLNQLMRRGLVSAKKEKRRTVFIIESPDRLHDLLALKEKEFARGKAAVEELIPHLKQRYRLAGTRPDVRVFDGIAQYEAALGDSIASKPREILAYDMLAGNKPAMQIREEYERQRIARKIQKRVLFFESDDALQALQRRRYDDFTRFRSIKKNATDHFSADLCLYDGKLLYTSYYDTYEPSALLIEDEALYIMQKNLFEMLWGQGKDQTLAFIKKP